jgi:hypothetical protein
MPLRTATLGWRKPTRFDFRPDAAQRDALALVLGISAIPALRFKGEVRPLGRSDLVLEAWKRRWCSPVWSAWPR